MSKRMAWVNPSEIVIATPAEAASMAKAIVAAEKRKPGRPKGGLNGRKRILTEAEVDALKRVADKKYGLIIRLTLELSLRSVELVNLLVSDFNFAAMPPEVLVRGAKGGFAKTYELPEPLAQRVKMWLKSKERTPKESPYLFPSRLYASRPLTTITVQQGLQRLLKAAGITERRSFHDLRHTSATRFAKMPGATAAFVASRLRHRDLQSAQAYIDLIDMKEQDHAVALSYKD